MNADDLRLTADQIVKITGCSPNVLKDITRTRGTKPPFLRPDFEANGQGHKDYYSWNNAMCVALFLELRKAGVERKIIIPSLWAAKKMDYKFKDLPPHYKTMIGHDGIGSNPFKELEIKKHPIEIHESNLKGKPIPEAEPIMFLSITPHINGLYRCLLGCENIDIFANTFGLKTKITASSSWIRVTNDQVVEAKRFEDDKEKKDHILGGIITFKFALNKLHHRVVQSGKNLGLI